MKKVNIFIVFAGIFFLSAGYDQPQEKYYYAFDEKIFLDKVADKIVLSFDKEYLSDIQMNLRNNVQIRHTEFQIEYGNCVLTTTENSDVRALMEDLKKQAGIKSVNPMYAVSGLEMGVTEEIIVQFKENASQREVDEIYRKYRVEVKEITEIFQILSVPIDFDPLEVANACQTSGLVNFSHPNFIIKIDLCQTLPTDPYFVNQYYLRNTGQTVNGRTCTAGADINVVNAWNITKGNSSIVVAVLDEGVTSAHPDLPNTRQVRLNGSNFGDGNANDPSPTGNDNHGNSCAGIIAASHNNEGIAGIAPNCKIMPIRIFNSNGTGISVASVASAITFAKNNGADIISNSWAYNGQTNPNYQPAIVSAISDATATGRNGKGCVVVFAASNTANHATNNNGVVSFPANVNIAGVLTVGASDRNDMQANYSPTSNLSSSYNQIIDVVAPSHKAYSCQVLTETFDVWTIDIPGNNGYNPVKSVDCKTGATLPVPGTSLPNSGTNYLAYTGYFGGTSAACPQVAGVAALILSVNPNLTQAQVASSIRSTARKAKAGAYVYQTTSGRPDGTWTG